MATIVTKGGDARASTQYKESNAIASLVYDTDEQSLEITFTDGTGPYVIEGFPEAEIIRWTNSPSLGGYFNNFIRGNY